MDRLCPTLATLMLLGLCGCEALSDWLMAPELPAGASRREPPPAAVSVVGGRLQPDDAALLQPPAACRDVATYVAQSRAELPAEVRQALGRWQPPQPAGRQIRAAVETLARGFIERCAPAQAVALASRLIAQPTVADGGPVAGHAALQASKAQIVQLCQTAGLQFAELDDGALWRVSLGHGAPNLQLLSHIDVLPAGTDWHGAPFVGRVEDHRLRGRGSVANKGPLAAALVMLATLSHFGLSPAGQLSLLISTTSQTDRSSLRRLASRGNVARQVLALDSSFPSANREVGQVGWYLQAPLALPRHPRLPMLTRVEAGLGMLQVPASAHATFVAAPAALLGLRTRLAGACERVGAAYHLKAPLCQFDSRIGRRQLGLQIHGRSALAATPEQGINPIGVLARLLHGLRLAPTGASAVLTAVDNCLADHRAAAVLGLSDPDASQVPLVAEPTGLHLQGGKVLLDVSLFRPGGVSATAFRQRLAAATGVLARRQVPGLRLLTPPSVDEPWASRADAALHSRLQTIFTSAVAKRGLSLPAGTALHPQSLLRPTLARTYPHAVGFGPVWPDTAAALGGPDESLALTHLGVLLTAYFEAALQLG